MPALLGKVVLAPLHPAVGRAIERAIGALASGPILLSSRGTGCTGTPPPLGSGGSRCRPVSACPHLDCEQHQVLAGLSGKSAATHVTREVERPCDWWCDIRAWP